jgi:TPR repeat protein
MLKLAIWLSCVVVLCAPGYAYAPDTPGALANKCGAGQVEACSSLGVRYLKADGVTHDIPEAVNCFRLSCDAGSPSGCINLGLCHFKGTGAALDIPEAQRLFGAAWRLFSDETNQLELSKSGVNHYFRAIWPSIRLGF